MPTPREIRSYFDTFTNYESRPLTASSADFQLKRVEDVLSHLGDPHRSLRCLHVAGTKGKGSTCAFAASILRAAGYRTGLYTSPHLFDLRERIRLLKPQAREPSGDLFPDCISEEELADVVSEVRLILEKFRQPAGLTYFEALTVVALQYFRRSKTDAVVLETGLGGRLDATNVVDADVCGLTPVSLDHQGFLGGSIPAIAAEKAAIIKTPRQKAVIAPQSDEAMEVILGRCREIGVSPWLVGRDIRFEIREKLLGHQSLDVTTPRGEYRNVSIPLAGHHQAANAAMAVGMVELLGDAGFRVSPKAVEEGLRNAVWPGRFEVVHRDPLAIVDCAHNPASVQVLVKTVLELLPGRRPVLILGVSADKDIAGMCAEFQKISDIVIATRSRHPRAHAFTGDELKRWFPGKTTSLADDPSQAASLAVSKAGSGGVILAAGSVFIAAEIRTHFLNF
ncbi:MAG: folylpolyglutamate synthase/dihydrofolate synthase family protein [Candidatus Omnitrophota bacterium]|nr:folylpolyglutamate synthase/dihydrofolate synthase family protein [Candidatus Omnitrophota bacterium]MDZ4241698.1 folylpolyglutamate synthase/dihydrofolate synthase family protein [Candidatus Omnitrophota bacterium]